MSKVPDFGVNFSNGTKIIERKSKKTEWTPYYIQRSRPISEGFVIKLRILDLDINNPNSWGIQIGCCYLDLVEKCEENLDGKSDNSYYIGSYIHQGIGYIAKTGYKEFNSGSGIYYGEPYGVDDEITMIVQDDKTVEYLKNDESQGIAHTLERFPVIPLVTAATSCKVEIISLTSIEEYEQ